METCVSIRDYVVDAVELIFHHVRLEQRGKTDTFQYFRLKLKSLGVTEPLKGRILGFRIPGIFRTFLVLTNNNLEILMICQNNKWFVYYEHYMVA